MKSVSLGWKLKYKFEFLPPSLLPFLLFLPPSIPPHSLPSPSTHFHYSEHSKYLITLNERGRCSPVAISGDTGDNAYLRKLMWTLQFCLYKIHCRHLLWKTKTSDVRLQLHQIPWSNWSKVAMPFNSHSVHKLWTHHLIYIYMPCHQKPEILIYV